MLAAAMMHDRKMKPMLEDISGGNDAMKSRVAFACQSGGSQTAFTASVLKALLTP
jgi:predicted acylesterase/phospholipase RssA